MKIVLVHNRYRSAAPSGRTLLGTVWAKAQGPLVAGNFVSGMGTQASLVALLVPTALMGAAFPLTMRLYEPKSEALTGKWNPPPVTKLQQVPALVAQ